MKRFALALLLIFAAMPLTAQFRSSDSISLANGPRYCAGNSRVLTVGPKLEARQKTVIINQKPYGRCGTLVLVIAADTPHPVEIALRRVAQGRQLVVLNRSRHLVKIGPVLARDRDQLEIGHRESVNLFRAGNGWSHITGLY